MDDLSGPTASATVEVPASAAQVYGWVTDLDTMAGFAEEAESMTWTSGEAAAPGAVFVGRNRNGAKRWSTTCTVTEAEPGRRFGFAVTAVGRLPIAHWEYAIEATGEDSCRVTESTWDRRPRWFRRFARPLTGVADRDAASRDHIAATLARIERYAAAR